MIIIFLINIASASFSFGWCPSVNVQDGFDIERYLGLWHEEVRDKDLVYGSGTCNTVEYYKDQQNDIKFTNKKFINGRANTIPGSLRCERFGGQCEINFFGLSPSRDYKIIQTDYRSFSVVYSCTSYFLFHIAYGWVLTREVNKLDLNPHTNTLINIQ
jgi:apolipoprotein D and lipocalin family protein